MDWLIFQDIDKYRVKDPDAIIERIEKAGITLRALSGGVLWANDPAGALDESKKLGPGRTLARTRLAGLRMCATQLCEYLEMVGKTHGNQRRNGK